MVTGTSLEQLGVPGNDYKHAEGNWDILGVSVTILGGDWNHTGNSWDHAGGK